MWIWTWSCHPGDKAFQVTRLRWTLPGRGLGPSPLRSCKLQIKQVGSNHMEHLAQKLFHSSTAKLWRNNEKPQWWTAFLDLIFPWHGSPIQLYSTQVALEMSGTANSSLVAINVDFLSLRGFSCWGVQKKLYWEKHTGSFLLVGCSKSWIHQAVVGIKWLCIVGELCTEGDSHGKASPSSFFLQDHPPQLIMLNNISL